MKIKTQELNSVSLNWAANVAEGFTPTTAINPYGRPVLLNGCDYLGWTEGGPLIERERMLIKCAGRVWIAYDYGQGFFAYGDNPLVAAMRCHVASRLGDEVDVPEELTK